MRNPKSQTNSNIQNSKLKFWSLCIWLLVIIWNLVLDAWEFTPCYAASPRTDIKAANKLYEKGRLDEALQKYNEASVTMPDSDIVHFNMGAALYKKGDYQKAQDYFTKALTSGDQKMEADTLYNMGNCKYKLGRLKENTDLSATVGLLRESLDYYKRAVEIDQKNTDARFNHEFVERELKILSDKLKQQQSNQDKQKEQEHQQEEQKQGACPTGKESLDSARDRQGKEDKEKEGQEGQSQQEQEQQKEEQEAAEESQHGESFDFAQDRQGKELSEEGARALLERYGQDEATPDYMDKGVRRTYDSEVLKDW